MSDIYSGSASVVSDTYIDISNFDHVYANDSDVSQFNDIASPETIEFEFPGVRPLDESSLVERILHTMQDMSERKKEIKGSITDAIHDFAENSEIESEGAELNPEMQYMLDSQKQSHVNFFEMQEALHNARYDLGMLSEQSAWIREIAKKGVDSVNKVINHN